MPSTIQIRKLEPSDAKGMQEIYACPSAYSNTLQLPHPTLDMWTKRLEHIPDNIHAYVAVINDEVVGNLGFEVMTSLRRRHVGEFGMAVKEGFQGQGVGSALIATAIDLADNWLNLQRIEITAYTDNPTAIHLYKKFGFVIEGEAVNYAFRNGEYVNAYFMARVRT